MSKVVNWWWYNNIGIVKVVDEITKEEKFYIGIGEGYDESKDIEYIKQNGYRFYPNQIM